VGWLRKTAVTQTPAASASIALVVEVHAIQALIEVDGHQAHFTGTTKGPHGEVRAFKTGALTGNRTPIY